MVYKYAAIAIILFVSFYTAFGIKKFGEEKISFYTAIIDFIEYIKNQITYFCAPTDDIISNYENEVLEKYGFLVLIDNNNWTPAIQQSRANRFIDARAAKILTSFSARLGKTSEAEQIANCDYAIASLSRLLDEQKQEIPRKTKVFSSLTVIFGFMVVILLL